MAKRGRKPKKVAYRFLPPAQYKPMYALLDELVDAHHEELRDAKIALAWNTSWQPDADGRMTLGKCQKVSDLHREVLAGGDLELEAYDFLIVLHREFWNDEQTTDRMRRALLDHELCHAMPAVDLKTGEQIVDERNRLAWRLRKHDLEEFACIAERYGCWKVDLEHFAQALEKSRSDYAYVGYRRVRDELAAAGVGVPLEIVAEWTDAQRKEAHRWATMRRDFPNFFDTMPLFVSAAVQSPAREEAR